MDIKVYPQIHVGEIVLSANDSCRLLTMNLQSYVNNAYLPNAEFDFDLFNKHTIIAQRLMDDLIDLELECIDKIINKIESDPENKDIKKVELDLWNNIKKACINGRRTGTGITALGDALAALNIKYGSKESIEMTEKIYKALALGCYRSTIKLAKERGAFPIFNHDLEKDHPFLQRIWNEDQKLYKEYLKYGRRNIALTTTAPTGSVSIQTQTTSGIEPAYLLSFVRRKKVNPSDKDARVDFIDDLGDKWQEFTVYHHGVKKWMDATGESDISKSPYFGATSNEIDWSASVDLQAAAQKWICHSLSKTCNLPENVSVDLVKEVYMKAWETGCKGFTIYRDGSRAGVLVSEETHKKQNNKDSDGRPVNLSWSQSPKRPNELDCDIHKVKINGENWTIFVGIMNGLPYEMFGGLSKYVDIPNKYKVGKIIKTKTYDLNTGTNDDNLVIKDIPNVFENTIYSAFTRTISLSLRHGASPLYIAEQLMKDKNSDLTSFSKVMARVLKMYIKDGTKSTEKQCSNCKKEGSLMYQEGCLTCLNCGFSKCG